MACRGSCAKDFEDKLLVVFKQLDKDGSGRIEKPELGAGIKSLGFEMDEKDIGQMFDCIDKNHDGTLDFDEFKKVACIAKCEIEHIEHDAIKNLFEQLDTDKSKKLDKHEVKSGLEKMGVKIPDDKFEHFFGIIDTDKSGHIDFREFAKVVHIAKIA
ncbi:hypothetical protein ACOME3_005548 [Neoechinorhynchus agilis]